MPRPRASTRRRFVLALGSSGVAACVGTPRAQVQTPDEPSRAATRAPEPEREAEPEPRGVPITVGGALLDVVLEGDAPPLPVEDFVGWVRTCAQMITDYFAGTFPVPGLEITIAVSGGGTVGFGSHQDGRWIEIRVGRRISARSFVLDWTMVHELLHACFPDLDDDHRWMQEGLSTYLEPVVRARAGQITHERVWERWTANMHNGRPGMFDRGLDRTHTWGRTYWGGAVFWLVADIRLRQATAGRKSLRDVMLHLASIGANGRVDWSTDEVLAAAEAATGSTAITEVYREQALAPGDTDLDALYAALGVVVLEGGGVRLDDRAPLAAIRRAITHVEG